MANSCGCMFCTMEIPKDLTSGQLRLLLRSILELVREQALADHCASRGRNAIHHEPSTSKGDMILVKPTEADILGGLSETIPDGLVSLWQMMNFSVCAFYLAIQTLEQELAAATVGTFKAPDEAGFPARISVEDQTRVLRNMEVIAAPLTQMGIAEGRLGDIFQMGRRGGTYDRLAHELAALKSDIRHATEFERFYHYPRDKGTLVLRVPSDWAECLKAFPSTKEDVRAGVDCYAMGHPNASIHHMMMVLERGLPAFAKRLRVRMKPDRSTWGSVIRDIRQEIDRRRTLLENPPRGTKPPTPKTAVKTRVFLDQCEEAAMQLRYFTNVWRNHVAHGHVPYDENDAKKVIEHVRLFMETLASKLQLVERLRMSA